MLSKSKQNKKEKEEQKKTLKNIDPIKAGNIQKQKQQEDKKKQNQKDQNTSTKQITAQQKQNNSKIENKKQNQQIQILIDANTLVQNSPNVTLLKILQSADIEQQNLTNFYHSNQFRNSKFLLYPYLIDRNQNKARIIYSTENIKTYKQMFLNIPIQFMNEWIIQIFYRLHPHQFQSSKGLYFRINDKNIYGFDSPFMMALKGRNEKLGWQNPLKVLIKETVKDQKQFLFQLHEFGEQFLKIKQFDDLQRIYYEKRIKGFQKQIFSITNHASKIQNQLICSQLLQKEKTQIKQKKKQHQFGPLTPQMIKWICIQANISPNLNIYLHYKASTCIFDPKKFWQVVSSLSKEDSHHQLIVMQIQSQKSNILLGFYSTLFTQNIELSKQPLLGYIADTNKKSILINISLRTIQHLVDNDFAFGFSNQILLCVGKCDLILSAYNITNLCYFPVSYAPDAEQICRSAQTLCGGKNFVLKQLYLFRFTK